MSGDGPVLCEERCDECGGPAAWELLEFDEKWRRRGFESGVYLVCQDCGLIQ